jgi:HPt (histidine-containing phosphotransfer) domain-containing protein
MLTPRRSAKFQAALDMLRERFRTSIEPSVASIRSIADQLDADPALTTALDGLRREAHRIHGTAGSVGYPQATTVAAQMERRVETWIKDPSLDREVRGTEVRAFAESLLEVVLKDDSKPAGPPPS